MRETLEEIKCIVCATVFVDYKTNHRKLCSVECADESFRGHNKDFYKESSKEGIETKRRNGTLKRSKETRKKISESRKIMFLNNPELRAEISKRQMGRNNSVYDSMRGKNNPRWKGGITPVIRAVRNLLEYKEWRRDIFERDNFICQMCGQVGGRLNVDHIKPFSEIWHKNSIKTVQQAKECSEFWDRANGRTLCYECHLSIPTASLNQYSYGK